MLNIKNKKYGISLIVLVITIIVLAILSAAVIISLSNTSIMTKARVASFKSDMTSFKEAYSMWYAKKTAETNSLPGESVNISYASDAETFTQIFGSNVSSEYISSLEVENGRVVFYTEDNERSSVLYGLNMIPNNCRHQYSKGVCIKCGVEKAGRTWKQTTSTSDIIEVSEDENLRNYIIYGNELLPNDYQQVTYLESTASQYIDTGVVPSNTYFQVDFAMMPTTLKTSGNYFYGSSGSAWLSYEYHTNNAYWNAGNTIYIGKHSMSANVKCEYSVKYSGSVLTSVGNANVASNYSGNLPQGKFVFFNSGINGTAFSSEKLYYLKLYSGSASSLVRNFLPCYRKADSEPGLYDLVEGKFYTNINNSVATKFSVGQNTYTNVGDLVTDTANEKYNKYKIPLSVTSGENIVTYNIYLDAPLRKSGDYADYIDFKNSKVVRYIQVVTSGEQVSLQVLNVPVEETISLPIVVLKKGSNTIKVGTYVNPSEIEIVYY